MVDILYNNNNNTYFLIGATGNQSAQLIDNQRLTLVAKWLPRLLREQKQIAN